MLILREKYVKYIYLIVFVLIQIIGFKTVQGIKCVQCGTSGIEECKDDLTIESKECTNNTFTKCFTQIDNNDKIIRGCHTAEEANKCVADSSCVSTDGDGNNQLVCKTCSDEDCSETDAANVTYSKICEPDSKCLKKVDENKRVIRECTKQSDVCKDKTNCETCDSVNCNRGIFPTNRRTCYQCSGDKCNDVNANSMTSKVCLLFQDNDECYTIGTSATEMSRGCKSDTDANKCSAIAKGCAFCSADGCNNLQYENEPTLKCYKCNGSSKNTSCYQNQAAENLSPCTKTVLYNQGQYCYTLIKEGNIERGCLNDDLDLTAGNCNDTEGRGCYKCNGDGCNGKDVEFTCIKCRSDNNPTCWNDATKLGGEKCGNNNSPTDGCFHGIWNGVAIRGCILEASEQVQALCEKKDNPNKCEICHSKDCNIKKSSGATHGLSFALMSIALIRVTLWNLK